MPPSSTQAKCVCLLVHLYFERLIVPVDEASMLYATATIIYGAFTVTVGEAGRRKLSIVVSIAIFAVSVVHYCLSIERMFRLFFTSLVFIGFLQCIWLLSTRISDPVVLKGMKQLALYGFGKDTNDQILHSDAFGVYYYVVFIEYLRLSIPNLSATDQKTQGVELIWPTLFSLPRVELTREKTK